MGHVSLTKLSGAATGSTVGKEKERKYTKGKGRSGKVAW